MGIDYISLAEEYCTIVFMKDCSKSLTFHTWAHTDQVVRYSREIAACYNLNPFDQQPLIMAAWFHDVGVSITFANHEESSKKIAHQFLTKLDYDKDWLSIVMNCISATKIPQQPKTLLERIICDADLYHLSSASYFDRSYLLRQELENHFGQKHTDVEWLQINYDFLKDHKYHTDYGRKVLEKGKQQNLAKLKYLMDMYGVSHTS